MGYRIISSNDHLEHYGVKGMKWGKHRSVTDYIKSRNESEKRVRLESEKVKASRDAGRAQSNMISTNAKYGYVNPQKGDSATSTSFTNNGKPTDKTYQEEMTKNSAAYLNAKLNISAVDKKLDAYDAKTKKKADKITSSNTSLSSAVNGALDKAKKTVTNFLNGLVTEKTTIKSYTAPKNMKIEKNNGIVKEKTTLGSYSIPKYKTKR